MTITNNKLTIKDLYKGMRVKESQLSDILDTYFILLVSNCLSSTICFRASIANSGMVNSAMTSMDATVLNFEYIGT